MHKAKCIKENKCYLMHKYRDKKCCWTENVKNYSQILALLIYQLQKLKETNELIISGLFARYLP